MLFNDGLISIITRGIKASGYHKKVVNDCKLVKEVK